ncbi:hypothetical protein BJ138DRAFT_1168620, partial [Hygrophoropsis aurantiaca]
MLICTFVAILLFGVTCAQTFYYFHRFPNDSYKIRCMIASIWLVQTDPTISLRSTSTLPGFSRLRILLYLSMSSTMY